MIFVDKKHYARMPYVLHLRITFLLWVMLTIMRYINSPLLTYLLTYAMDSFKEYLYGVVDDVFAYAFGVIA